MRVGLGTTIAYLIGIVADTADLVNILWHPAFLAVASHGATIRRAGTRFTGTAIGCLVAIISTIAVMPNISELPALAILLFAVTMPSAYLALGRPRFAYVGVQIVVAFVIVALAEQAHADVATALWRVYGTLLGTAALFLAFRVVAPDCRTPAGRPLYRRRARDASVTAASRVSSAHGRARRRLVQPSWPSGLRPHTEHWWPKSSTCSASPSCCPRSRPFSGGRSCPGL